MTRRLVLTNEAAGHPFRRLFPPPPRVTQEESRRAREDGDFKLFLLSFAAFFTCFYTMIA